jgi:Thiol:disulfide interchange protein DsbD, N-terminal
MRLRTCCRFSAALLTAAAALLLPDASPAQFRGVQAASVMPPTAVQLKAGEDLSIPLKIAIRPGYHINSNTPAEDYLIPTRLTWRNAGLKLKSVEYPKAESVQYEFSEKPLSVYSGTITLRSVLAVPAPIPPGLKDLTAKLRYQACNEKACLPPVTVDVTVPVTTN